MKKAFFLIFVIASGCYHFKEQSGKMMEEAPLAPSRFVDSTLMGELPLSSLRSAKSFYAARNFELFWSAGMGFSPAADSMVRIIQQANRFGLIPADYHQGEIEKLLTDSLPSAVARADILLTDSYLTFYHHIRYGRLDPTTLERSDLRSTLDQEAILSLQNSVNNSLTKELQSVEPTMTQYQQLRSALLAFRFLGAKDSVQRRRAEKISLNMERWRWQRAWPDRYVLVNIPSFQMLAVENDSVWLKSKVIVGKRDTPTPVMESVIRSFIIYPYWHVPASISTREILPRLQEDLFYLGRNNFEVLNKRGIVIPADTIHWELYREDYFPFVLRQREGSENSMGIIKFNFTNSYGVYLHDTNNPRLFKRARRDFSHGCVRVNKAVALAHYLVREDDIYVSPEDLDQYLSLQQRLEIKLRKPIPLKLEYFTCEVEHGATFFYEDIYKKDSVMMHSLQTGATGPLINEKPSF